MFLGSLEHTLKRLFVNSCHPDSKLFTTLLAFIFPSRNHLIPDELFLPILTTVLVYVPMSESPVTFESARVGRDRQRYATDAATGRRARCVVVGVVIAAVASDAARDNGDSDDAGPAFAARHFLLLVTGRRKREAWSMPKGGWESDETVSECAVRETFEEGGVRTVPEALRMPGPALRAALQERLSVFVSPKGGLEAAVPDGEGVCDGASPPDATCVLPLVVDDQSRKSAEWTRLRFALLRAEASVASSAFPEGDERARAWLELGVSQEARLACPLRRALREPHRRFIEGVLEPLALHRAVLPVAGAAAGVSGLPPLL